jgi:hypothetical protein
MFLCPVALKIVQLEKIVRMDILRDLWLFLRERKKFWLAPVIVVLLLLGILIVIGGSSALAPFIYTLF